MFGFVHRRIFSIQYFLLPPYFMRNTSSQNNKYFFGQTTKLSQETSTVALDVLALALRGVENN